MFARLQSSGRFFILLVLVIGWRSFGSSVILPLRMPKCRPSDENCLCAAATHGLRVLKSSNPARATPQLDPFCIDRINIRRNYNSRVSFEQDYYNMKFIGISTGKVTRFIVKYDENYCRITFDIFMERFLMKSIYQWQGKVMGFAIDGIGTNQITSINVTHTHDLTFARTKEDKLLLRKYTVNLDPKDLQFEISNMVRDDPGASARALKLFNIYSTSIFNEVKPYYNQAFSQCFQPYICEFFKDMSFKHLFLPEKREKPKKK